MNSSTQGSRQLKNIITAILIMFTLNTAQASHYYLQLEKVKEIGKNIAILSYCIEHVWLKENAPEFVKLRDELRGYDYSFEMENDIPDNIANEAFIRGIDVGNTMANTYLYDRTRCNKQYMRINKFLKTEKQE